jgi:hypothetical protein
LQRFRGLLEAKNLLIEGHDDDIALARYLKARKWDEAKAAAMWRDMVSWRCTYATLPADPPFQPAEVQAVCLGLYIRSDSLLAWSQSCVLSGTADFVLLPTSRFGTATRSLACETLALLSSKGDEVSTVW